MGTKDQLIKTIKDWVKIDNEIREIQTQLNIRKNEKKKISENLIHIMRENTIDCFDINDGSLVYKKNTVRKPINSKTLLASLQNYYKDQNVAEDLTKYIMDNREEQIKETIKRKIHK